MNNPDLLTFLNTFPKINLMEAYTNRHIRYLNTPWLDCDVSYIVEVRLRANEPPDVYYETESFIKAMKERANDAKQPR